MHLRPRLAFCLIALGAISQPSGAHAQSSAPQFNAADRPDEAAGRAALQGIISGPKASTLEISEFKKTDGLAGEFGGVRRYNMEFSAVVVLTEAISISFGGAIIGSASKIVALPPVSDPMSALMTQSGRASKGDRLILTGKIDFMRYESGWRPTEVSFDRRVDSTGRPSASSPVSAGGTDASALEASVASSEGAANRKAYPISSGRNIVTRVVVENQTRRPIQLYLDDSDAAIEIPGFRIYETRLEVGSTHKLVVIVGGKEYEREIVVATGMKGLEISAQGLRGWRLR